MALRQKFILLIILSMFSKLCIADDPFVLECNYKDVQISYEETDQYQCSMENDFPFIVETAIESASTNHLDTKNNDAVTVLTIYEKKIFQIPNLKQIFSKLSFINIRNTPLRYLKRKYIEGYENTLKHFVIMNSNIEFIEKDLLTGFTKLETIDFQNNQILYIHADAFKDRVLKILKIRGNGCQVADKDVGNFDAGAGGNLMEFITKIGTSTCAPLDMDKLFEKYQESKVKLDVEAEEQVNMYEKLLDLKNSETIKCTDKLSGMEGAVKTAEDLLKEKAGEVDNLKKTVQDLNKDSEALKKTLKSAQDESNELKYQVGLLESAAEKCLDVKGTCRFTNDAEHGYTCIARNISITSAGTEIDWSGDHIKNMLDKNVNTLLIRDINVQFVPKNIANKFYRIKILIIEKCGLQKLSKNDFIKLNYLLTIEITSNNISSIDSATFEDTDSLEILNLSDNKIQSLPSKIFDSLNSLNTLKLDGNFLTALKTDLILTSNRIKYFSATNNELAKVESTFVWKLRNANFIDFSGNVCGKKYDKSASGSYINFYGEILMQC